MKKSMLFSMIVVAIVSSACEDKEVVLARINANKEITIAKMNADKPVIVSGESGVISQPQQIASPALTAPTTPTVIVTPGQTSSTVGSHMATGALAAGAGFLAGKVIAEKNQRQSVDVSKPYVEKSPSYNQRQSINFSKPYAVKSRSYTSRNIRRRK